MKRSVAVDLDGTLAPHPSAETWDREYTFIEPFSGAKEFLEELSKDFHIIIYTCRCTAGLWSETEPSLLRNQVSDWLDKYDLPYDHIWIEQGKPVADVIIDDRAVSCIPTPNTSFEVYDNVLEHAKKVANIYPVEPKFRREK
jgi:hypothetical protein